MYAIRSFSLYSLFSLSLSLPLPFYDFTSLSRFIFVFLCFSLSLFDYVRRSLCLSCSLSLGIVAYLVLAFSRYPSLSPHICFLIIIAFSRCLFSLSLFASFSIYRCLYSSSFSVASYSYYYLPPPPPPPHPLTLCMHCYISSSYLSHPSHKTRRAITSDTIQ